MQQYIKLQIHKCLFIQKSLFGQNFETKRITGKWEHPKGK